MEKLLQIAQLGHKILRTEAKPIENIESEDIQELIDSMIATVKDVNGVGIAAPQVYENKRLFVVASNPNARYPNAPKMEPTPMINPKILSHSEEKVKDWEGCLSIPGIRALVPRYKTIEVEYIDRKGEKITRTFEDFVARIFQHELDHLDGLVFLDRLDDNKDIVTDKEYQKVISLDLNKKNERQVSNISK